MTIIELVNVSKNFGGLKAVHELNFKAFEKEILGIIGPNGAGKTTVFNLITGFMPLDQGEIRFQGKSIAGLRPHDVCKVGITRTFQIVKPFSGLTVLENVMIGQFHLTKDEGTARKEAIKILDFLKLSHLMNTKAASLTISDRKRLEIARSLATKPKLLLLDEPMGGMNPTEVENMIKDIEKVRRTGVTIIIIEHVMRAIMSISDRILVLHHGEKITVGKPDEVISNQDVITAYLGEDFIASRS